MGKISMVSEILITHTSRCNVCHEVKLIEFTVSLESDRMFGVCRECRNKLLAERGIVSEDRAVSFPRAS